MSENQIQVPEIRVDAPPKPVEVKDEEVSKPSGDAAPIRTSKDPVLEEKTTEIKKDTPNHEPKRPAKHLTLFNDGLIDQYREANKLTDMQEDVLACFTRQKLVVNSIICRNSAQLIWSIPDFSEQSRKAKLRLAEPLQSDSFYTEPFGYRLRAILAPYGSNQAYGDAISFHIQLLPGDYDPILRWPFESRVLFTLYDQNPEVTKRLDFRYELVPNTEALQINQLYLRRPQLEEENGLLGVESFVSLDQLFDGTYIQNDTMIVGISIYD
ncbi:TNF receptor-associated factor 4-like isoform X3 [Aphelenchoides bicaudatus]|nr:TNF receptor-associated factor 4-like isoform X3 [Aphelenchoides bicaudatus]